MRRAVPPPLMTVVRLAVAVFAAATVLAGARAGAEEALGVFVVKGRTTSMRYSYVTMEANPEDRTGKYLITLLSDVPVAPADRTRDRLLELARAGRVRALKVRWGYGLDDVSCVPYHADIAESGLTHRGYMILNLLVLNEKKVAAQVRSKMLGQDWHFDVRVEGEIREGGVAQIEPPFDGTPSGSKDGEQNPLRRQKLDLGRMGFEYTPEGFRQAVTDGNAEAVRIFLKAGMDPDTRDFRGDHMMYLAASLCAVPPPEKRGDVVLALIQGGSDVNGGKGPKALALIWAAQHCAPKVVQAMVDAGADVNARAPGGATPLMMSGFRQDGHGEQVAAILRKAGARE